MALCVYEEGRGQDHLTLSIYVVQGGVHGAVLGSEVWEGKGGGPAEGEGSEGMKDTVINYCVST